MAQFQYVAVNKKGERVKGAVDAPDENEVRVVLRAQSLRPIRISKAGVFEVDLAALAGARIKRTDVIAFTRQLSILIGSGIPLVDALDIITNQTANADMKRVILSMKEKITGGSFLWESMKKNPNVFEDFFVSMIRAGESSGALDAMLKRLLKYMDDSEKLRRLVQGAMVYPIAIILVAVSVIFLMLTFVIPKFEELLKTSNQELPGPTQLVITASHFFQHNVLYIVGGVTALGFLIRNFLKTEDGRKVFDAHMLSIPGIGSLVLKGALARFSRTLHTLLASGINILDALDICKSTIGNKTLEENVGRIRKEVETGKSLAATMGKMPIFPNMVVQMINVGESTGNLDKMLERIADLYEEDLQNAVASLSKLIEPVILVVLGGVVGGLMISMYLPIFKMAGGA
ncbi:MAG: type II secretion system F family protein [Bacteriovoracia bacterium]